MACGLMKAIFEPAGNGSGGRGAGAGVGVVVAGGAGTAGRGWAGGVWAGGGCAAGGCWANTGAAPSVIAARAKDAARAEPFITMFPFVLEREAVDFTPDPSFRAQPAGVRRS